MTMQIGVFEAKTQLLKLLERVRKGERITITKQGVPVAELVPPGKIDAVDVNAMVKEFQSIRKRTKRGSATLRELIEEGRRF